MIPFFVADRPMSLRLLKGLPLNDYPDVHIGIMAHANTTANFQQVFRQYPCDDFDFCDAVGGPCQYRDDIHQCPFRQHILSHTIKMCDSGIFTREGATLSYQQLFEAYQRMGVEYGIMIDVFRDAQATIESAREAWRIYQPFRNNFRLIGVTHGETVDEYLACYAGLRELGFEHIAVGGLLRRRPNTVRFPYLPNQDFMFQVLSELRQLYPNDWLFALGCLHPSRLAGFQGLNVWADYKGWIFQYDKRDQILAPQLVLFANNHLQHLEAPEATKHVAALQRTVSIRNKLIAKHKEVNQDLIAGRRTLRFVLNTLYEEMKVAREELAPRLKGLITHGLLDKTELNILRGILTQLGRIDTEEAHQIFENADINNQHKRNIDRLNARIIQANNILAKRIAQLVAEGVDLDDKTTQVANTIATAIDTTERDHRFSQVRSMISKEILALLQI